MSDLEPRLPWIVSKKEIAELICVAERSPRKRQHLNLHTSFDDPFQRLINAIGMESYIRPHRHLTDPKTECLLALRGKFVVITFDDSGVISRLIPMNPQSDAELIEIPPGIWHTVISTIPGSILFEAKAGPFQPKLAKEPAPWAPPEDSPAASAYHVSLRSFAISSQR